MSTVQLGFCSSGLYYYSNKVSAAIGSAFVLECSYVAAALGSSAVLECSHFAAALISAVV